MLCPVCTDKPVREKLTLENCTRLLWIPPPFIINENMFDEWDDADQSFGTVDYSYQDDEPLLLDDDYNIDDDSSLVWDYDQSNVHDGDDALETEIEAYGY